MIPYNIKKYCTRNICDSHLTYFRYRSDRYRKYIVNNITVQKRSKALFGMTNVRSPSSVLADVLAAV